MPACLSCAPSVNLCDSTTSPSHSVISNEGSRRCLVVSGVASVLKLVVAFLPRCCDVEKFSASVWIPNRPKSRTPASQAVQQLRAIKQIQSHHSKLPTVSVTRVRRS